MISGDHYYECKSARQWLQRYTWITGRLVPDEGGAIEIRWERLPEGYAAKYGYTCSCSEFKFSKPRTGTQGPWKGRSYMLGMCRHISAYMGASPPDSALSRCGWMQYWHPLNTVARIDGEKLCPLCGDSALLADIVIGKAANER